MAEESTLPVLSPVEQRVVGALLEKQVTVPASYPLSLNALRTACNQTSSREPVMDLPEQEVEQTARALKDRGLVRIVWTDSGRRTLKYHQTLAETLDLEDDERALLTVLLLRGPQAPGELRSRTERMHAFDDRDDVASCLVGMAERGFVRQLERRPGDRDRRWVHLLGAVDTGEPEAAAAPVDREAPIAQGAAARDARVRSSYAAVAGVYAERIGGELDGLPFERWLLDRVAAHAVEADGPVADTGCGPGHVTSYLTSRGARAQGFDLVPEMVEQARAAHPDDRFEVGDLRRLMRPTDAAGWAAVLGWYSLVHLTDSELPGALESLVRPLAPGGLLVLGLHSGRAVHHADTWFDVPIEGLDLVSHDRATVVAAVEAAGLVEVEWFLRGPIARRDETTERLYVVARRPA